MLVITWMKFYMTEKQLPWILFHVNNSWFLSFQYIFCSNVFIIFNNPTYALLAYHFVFRFSSIWFLYINDTSHKIVFSIYDALYSHFSVTALLCLSLSDCYYNFRYHASLMPLDITLSSFCLHVHQIYLRKWYIILLGI